MGWTSPPTNDIILSFLPAAREPESLKRRRQGRPTHGAMSACQQQQAPVLRLHRAPPSMIDFTRMPPSAPPPSHLIAAAAASLPRNSRWGCRDQAINALRKGNECSRVWTWAGHWILNEMLSLYEIRSFRVISRRGRHSRTPPPLADDATPR